MDIQTTYKKDLILNTLNRGSEMNQKATPDILVSIFNIPLKDAKAIIKHYYKYRKIVLILYLVRQIRHDFLLRIIHFYSVPFQKIKK